MANPPPIPLLESLGSTVPQKKDVQSLRIFLLLLWERVGGGSDLISDDFLQTFGNLGTGFQEAFADYYIHSISLDYTTIGNELIEVTAPCVITLNNEPNDGEIVEIFHNGTTGDLVQITDGVNTDNLRLQGRKVCYQYNAELDRWVP